MANNLVVIVIFRPMNAVGVVSVAWIAFASGNVAHLQEIIHNMTEEY